MLHTVVFKLKYEKESPKESQFFNEVSKLSLIPGVLNFKIFRQTSNKNDFDYCLSMKFETIKEYENYNNNPIHVHFVETYWVNYVEKFLELDYESY
ncbi:stress responsive alpha-beta barrel domain-containing protein [Polaribacter reichenbachii]|nr:Dabb family protein [Polaribacter reichenbachii]APZ44942.1 stress responsive alpha-beta barrel domain-containing protein [Polaribacter reichenbachii]AUC18805.1 stress responsive alpha-beta barrel domain-containing protein [Polaribacter reichenbachii]